MGDILMAVLVAVYYFTCFFVLGTCLLRLIRVDFSLPLAMVTGGFSYYLFFNIVALPMKLKFYPLSTLTKTWCGVVVVGMALLIVLGRKALGQAWKESVEKIRKMPKFYLCIFGLILVQYVYMGSVTSLTAGVTDDRYYIGDVMTSLYTNTIQQYSYIDGGKRAYLEVNYLLQMYPIHTAVVSQVTRLHPLIENKWVLTATWLVLVNCVFYLWGRLLFKENSKKVFWFLVIITWCTYAQRLVTESFAQHLVYRMAEGKNLLANLIVPFLFYLFARIVKSEGRWQNWFLVLWTVMGSYCLVMSSFFILPLVTGSFYACYVVLGRRWGQLVSAVLCFVPCVAVLYIYLLETSGKLLFYVP